MLLFEPFGNNVDIVLSLHIELKVIFTHFIYLKIVLIIKVNIFAKYIKKKVCEINMHKKG